MTNKILLLVVFALASLHAFAQQPGPADKKPSEKTEEKDSVKVTAGRVVAVLTDVKGWGKLQNGKWASSANRIPYDDPEYNNDLYDKYLLGNDNFRQMRLQEMTVDGKKYLALIVQYMKGYYKNQEDQSDWHYFYSADYYLFDKADFKKILPDSIPYGKPFGVSLRAYYTGTVPASDINKVPARIGKDINKNLRVAYMYDTTVKPFFQFALYPIHDKRGKYIRFNTGMGYAKTGSKPAKVPFENFSLQYYELPFDRFKSFVTAK